MIACNADLGHPCDANDGEPCDSCREWLKDSEREARRDYRLHIDAQAYRQDMIEAGRGHLLRDDE